MKHKENMAISLLGVIFWVSMVLLYIYIMSNMPAQECWRDYC